MSNELTIPIKQTYSIDDVRMIKEKTGYNLLIPADQDTFIKVCNSIKYVLEHHDYYDELSGKTSGVMTCRERYYVTVKNLDLFCGSAYCQAMLAIAVTDLCNFFNIGRNMDVEQIKQTTELMLQSPVVRNMAIIEIRDCFDRIKSGQMGTVYDRLDGNFIMEKLHQYMDKRLEYINYSIASF